MTQVQTTICPRERAEAAYITMRDTHGNSHDDNR
jgi:hypothetical protein